MRKLKLFLDAKAANTPPRGISKASRVIFSVLTLLFLSIGQVWATDYQLVTSTDDLEAGANYVIGNAASTSGIFMATTSNNNNRRGTASITISNNKITATDAVLVLQLGGSTGAWTFLTTNYAGTDGYLAAASNNSNYCQVIADGTAARAKFTISFNGNAVVITATGGGNRRNMRYNPNNGSPIFACYQNATDQSPIYLYKEVTSGGNKCATPIFEPAAGAVLSGTEVAISCATDGAKIHYTTDGTEPDANSSEYSSAITINEAKTIKAIAVKSGYNNSSVATAAYTITEPLSTMQAIFDAASTAGNYHITFSESWVVTGVSTNGKNVYITDGTKGMILFNNSANMGLAVGNTLSGTVQRSLKKYNGAAELDGFTTEGLTVGTADLPNVQVLDAEGVAALSGVNTGSLIKISGTCDIQNSKCYVAGVQLYNALFAFESPADGSNCTVSGVYAQYNNTKEILPRSQTDIVETVTKYTVTITTPENGTLAVLNGEDAVNSGAELNENTVLTISTQPAEGYKLVGVTVNGNAYAESTLTLTENVTIAASFEENEAPLVETFILSEIGTESSHLVSGQRVGDKVNLPETAATCSKVFRGWSENANCATVPTYAPGAEYTLALNNKLYAVYADAHVVTPTDHALGSATFLGSATGGNTASEGYTLTTNKTNDKSGYTQDSGTKDADIVHLQIKAESQIINEEPSAIIVTAHLGAGANRDELTYPVNAVLVDADGNNVGDPVVLTNSIPDKNGDDFSVELPTANYADVRGVKISHMKEDGWNVRYYSMSFKYQTGGTTYDNYSTDCQAQVATPTFSVEAGTYTEVQSVEISCTTAEALIYYTTNGDEPTESSTLYEGAIEVAADMTIKAIAVKSGLANSAVASAAYEINLPVYLTTMDEIYEAATQVGSTATDVNVMFSGWVVSAVSSNGKQVYVTYDEKGFIIFDNGGEMGFAVGDVLSGTVACKVQLFNGAAELTQLSSTSEGLSIAQGGSVTPSSKLISELGGINTGALIAANGVQFDGTNLSDGTNSIKPYNSLCAYDALENGAYYNVRGIYLQYGNTKEILPRSAEDIEKLTLTDPELAYSPESETIELGDDWTAPTLSNQYGLTLSYESSNPDLATVSDAGVVALVEDATGTAIITASFAGDATYAEDEATYTITVNAPDTRLVATGSAFEAVSGDLTPANIKFAAYKGDGTTNPAINNSNIRIYKPASGNSTGGYLTLTAIMGFTIDQVEITFDGNATASYALNDDAFSTEAYITGQTSLLTPANLNAQSVSIVNLKNGSIDVKAIKVWYTGEAMEIDHYFVDATNATTEFVQYSQFNYEGLKVYAAYDLQETITEEIFDFTATADLMTAGAKKADVYRETVKIAEYDIVVTESQKQNPALAYNPTSDEITFGDAWTAPEFSNPLHVVGVVFSSNKTSVAKVTNEGVITLEGGCGTAVITAHFAETTEYVESTATYTIIVNEPAEDLSGTWTLASSVAAGDRIIIADVAVAGELFTMGAQNGNYREQVASTVDGEGKLTPAEGTKVFTLVDASTFDESYEGFALKATNGNYLSAASNSSNNIKEVASVSDKNAVWSIEITEGVAAIVAQGTFARKVIRYNASNTRFSCYAEENSMADVVIYKHGAAPEPPTPQYETVRGGLTAGNYYTVCFNKTMTAIQGASLWSFCGKSASMAYIQEAEAPYAAGTPYLIYAESDKLEAMTEVVDGPVAGSNNGLYGTFEYLGEADLAGKGATHILKNNELRPLGSNNHLDAYRAYVILNDIQGGEPAPAPGRRVRAIPMQTNGATGFENIEASEKPVKLMLNGQMYILRGEKMYDATGRLVK